LADGENQTLERVRPMMLEKDRRIAQLEKALHQKDLEIGRKDDLIAQRDAQVSQLTATIESLRQHGNSGQQKDT
jgi:uncharacterized protein (DUF3084 family)